MGTVNHVKVCLKLATKQALLVYVYLRANPCAHAEHSGWQCFGLLYMYQSVYIKAGAPLSHFRGHAFCSTACAAGMICPHIVNWSMLFGAILSWGIMWPLMQKKEGDW